MQFVGYCWTLWNNRNGVVHGEQRRDPAEMVESARSYLMRFNEAKSQFDAPRPPEAAAVWSPPISPMLR